MYISPYIDEPRLCLSPGCCHVPVLCDTVAEFLVTAPGATYVDCTIGGGGHAEALLCRAGGQARLIGLDADAEAVELARNRLRRYAGQALVYQANFAQLGQIMKQHGDLSVAGVLFDLGLSSLHIDEPQRGFSYRIDGPLDMRMDRGLRRTAGDVVNWYTRHDLIRIFRDYGEERHATQISRAITRAREGKPIETTLELSRIIQSVIPGAQPQKTLSRIFQAIRIEVNDELVALPAGLEAAFSILAPGGRIAVISYHSLEDRIVKSMFFQKAKGCICPPDLPQCSCGRAKELRLLTRGAVRPGLQEIETNPRARSARLRVAEKL